MDSPPPNPAALDPAVVSGSGPAPPDRRSPEPQRVEQAETVQKFSTLPPSPSAAAGDSRAPGAPSTSQPLTLHSQLPPTIPDYDLLRRIGSGSYGDVWLARNVLGQCRAVKIIYRSRFVDPRPFEREFDGIQRFEPISRSHPSQLHILHVGKNDAAGCFYYVMELADDANAPVAADVRRLTPTGARVSRPAAASRGQSASENSGPLPAGDDAAAGDSRGPRAEPPHVGCYEPRTLRSDLQRHGRLPPADCVQIGLSLATALAHLHEQGLVHRDIKPSNIIFVNGVAKLGDIGLVTDAGDTQSIVGTEGYLPPEGPGTPQADLFSLGKVLYEISTGMDRRRFAELPDDLRAWPDCTAVVEFNEIVLKACAKHAEQRYASADKLRADLEWLEDGKSVRHERTLQRLWANCTKAGIALVILALVAGVLLMAQRRLTTSDYSGEGPDSTNRFANMYCAKGLLIVREDNHPQYPEAYTNFQKAIELDPHFARPYVGLLDLQLRHYVPKLGAMTPEKWQSLASRLKQLAPGSAPAALAESIISFYDWDFVAASRAAQQAVNTSPGYELAHIWYGFMLMCWGRTTEARAHADISQSLAPSKATSYRLRGHTYYVERDFTNAIPWYDQATKMDPHEWAAAFYKGRAQQALGYYSNAIATFETRELLFSNNEPKTRKHYEKLLRALNDRGLRGYWEEEWRCIATKPNGFYDKAVVQMHLGQTNAALNGLERSFATHERSGGFESDLISLLFDECWDGVRDDPRFKELLDKVGFTKVMPKRP